MITVVHWINITRLYRCHIPFKDTDDMKHWHFVYPLTRWGQLYKKPHMKVGNVRQLLFLEKNLGELKPDVVICTNPVELHIMETVRKYCKYFFYVHHAIWSDEIIDKHRNDPELLEKFKIFDRIYCTNKEADMFIEMGFPKEKMCRVRGVIYFDEVRQRNMQKAKNFCYAQFRIPRDRVKKFILFIHNTGFHCRKDGERKDCLESSDDYKVILHELVKYAEANECHVFTKIKKKSMDLRESNLIRSLHNHPRVTVIRPEERFNLLSMFLFADAVILQGYGTSYVETLLVNPRIAPCFVNADVTFDMDKYPLMPVIKELKEIQPMVDDFIKNPKKWETPEIKEQIGKIMEDQFGGPIQNVTKKIVSDIKDFVKSSSD